MKSGAVFKMMKKRVDINSYKGFLVGILAEVDDFCRRNGLTYFLTGGTLLGAVRHRGFIPWDDDIDIAMLREDYEKLLRTFKPSEKYYKLLSIETDPKYIYPYAKIVDTRVSLLEAVPGAIPMGAYIDVFPLDNCPGRNEKTARRNIRKMSWLLWVRNFKVTSLHKKRSVIKNAVLCIGKILFAFVSKRKIAERLSKKAKRHMFDQCDYVAGLVNITYGYGELLPKKFFSETVDLVFENHSFKASKNYDEILESLYGNYMELPPKEKRVTHHIFDCWYTDNALGIEK